MKVFRFLLSGIITFGIFFGMNYKWGQIPPVGKFLDPFHGFWQNAETNTAPLQKEIQNENIKGSVRIKYDDRMVPHIFASNDYDLYFAQGFVTAQHRLWQTETQILFASGRLSEKLGDKFLDLDREQRRIGMVYGAQHALDTAMEIPEVKLMLNAYAEGFNHFLETLSDKDLPVEYKLLDYKPEKWTPLKTCLLLKYMAKDLAGNDPDFEMTNVLKILGRENFDLFYSDVARSAKDPVIPPGTLWNFTPVETPTLSKDTLISSNTNPTLRKSNRDNGSNNWAVSGTKTLTGKTILANDPHLGLNLPSIWYEIQLHSKNVNVYGVSIPGAPGVIIGFNDSISWGVTNSQRYVKDWYKITFRKNKGEYLYDDKWLKTDRVIEEIKVRGKEIFYDTVYYTIHGPVVFDEKFPSKNKPAGYALRWIAHNPSLEALAFYKLNRGRNYSDYVNALRHYDCPAQNFVFASASGDIAHWVAGKFLVKWQDQGRFLLDGNKPSHLFRSYIPFEHSPNVLNPPRRFVSSANQHPVDSTYPYQAFDGDFEFYRNRRINEVLNNKNQITAQDLMDLQNDNYNLMAAESLPFMLSQLDTNNLTKKERGYFQVLRAWNYFHDQQDNAAPIYHLWFEMLYTTVWDEMQSDSLALPLPPKYTTIKLIKNSPDHFIFDVKKTPSKENATALIRTTFKEALKRVENLKKKYPREELAWGNFKGTKIRHLLRLEPFNTDTLINGGCKSCVNALSDHHGPSWRMVVEMGNEIVGYGVYPGGQSGNPGSPYYTNFVETWRKGKYYKLRFLKPNENNNIIFSQTIQKKN